MLCCKNLWFQHISRVILSSVFLFSMCEWKITVLYHVLAGKKKRTTHQRVWQTKLKSITINFVSNVHVQVWNGFFLIWTTCKLAITVHQREITLFYFGVSTGLYKYRLTHTIFNKHTQYILECMCPHFVLCKQIGDLDRHMSVWRRKIISCNLFQNHLHSEEFVTVTVFLLTFICLFIVMTKRTIKYMTKIGQKTGMLKNSKNVHVIAMTIALVAPYLGRENTSSKKDWSVLLMRLIITIKKFSNLIGCQLSWYPDIRTNRTGTGTAHIMPTSNWTVCAIARALEWACFFIARKKKNSRISCVLIFEKLN